MCGQLTIPIVLVGTLTLILVSLPYLFSPAYSHGFDFDEHIATIGDKSVTLYLQMKPGFLPDEQVTEGTILMELRDSAKKPIPHATLSVVLEKDGKVLMSERFHDHEGKITIQVKPKELGIASVFSGGKDEKLDAWIKTEQSPIVIEGPIFLDGGIYRFKVDVLSMETDQNFLPQPVSFELDASVSELVRYIVTHSDDQYELAVRTYYDKVADFSYDEEARSVSFSMPFNWDISFINQVKIVHEEVDIPKALTDLITVGYNASVNGVRLSQKAIVIDDVDPDLRLVHFIIPTERLIVLEKDIRKMPDAPKDRMVFTLTAKETPNFPIEFFSSTGNVRVQLSWSPATVEPEKPTKFIISLWNAKTGDSLRHSTFDVVLSKDGSEFFRSKQNAVIGAAVIDYVFQPEHAGTVELKIDKINNKDEFARFSLTVVPEFPIGSVFIVIAGLLAIMLTLVRFKGSFLGSKTG